MKIPSVSAAFLGLLIPLAAQEAAPVETKWDVEIPEPIIRRTPAEPRPEPAPIRFNVRQSRTFQRDVKESPPMPGLPPVAGTINITVNLVDDPALPDPPPLPALPPGDPAVIARLKEERKNHRGTDLTFISATVYNKSATLLRIYPNGRADQEVIAWSNLNFLHFSGFRLYRVHFGDDTFQDHGLLMGVSNIDTDRMRQWASRSGRTWQSPEIPPMPDLAESGPVFLVVEGDADSPAMDVLEQVHDLYRTSGKTMEEAFHAREKATGERREHFRANPPEPGDITIQFWKRN